MIAMEIGMCNCMRCFYDSDDICRRRDHGHR